MGEVRLRPIGDQVVVVMGASSGIGRETARRFAGRGAKVVVSARSVPGLESLVGEIRAAGGEAVAEPADVSDFAQVAKVADAAVQHFGGLDTWVHAAAVSVYAPFQDLQPEELARVIDVNLVGQGYGALAALPHLQSRGGGALIHISSMLAETAFPLQAPYNASKHGLKGMIDTMRLDLAHAAVPVSVTNVMPGAINTPLFDKARARIGVAPTAPPPVYEASVVADAILRAAETPLGDVVVGGAGKVQTVLSRFAPGLADTMARAVGTAAQRTDEPIGERPGNLFEPVAGHDTVEGHFGVTRSTSAWTWLDSHAVPGVAAAGRAVRGVAESAGRLLAKDGAGRPGDGPAASTPGRPSAGTSA